MPFTPLPVALQLGLVGIVVGSFSGALQTRLPGGRSIVAGRSTCDSCGRRLGVRDLVPLASWLALRGRCRHCRAPIDPVQPVAEAACGLVGFTAPFVLQGMAAWAGALLGWLLLTIAMIDARHLWLPNALTAWLALAGAAASLAGYGPTPAMALAGALAGYGTLELLAAAYHRLRKIEGLGGGDPKLLGAIGIWVGPAALPYVALAASLAGLIGWLAIHLWRRNGTLADRLPLGTLLALAGWPIWIWQVRAGF